jgi:hypothetical protein
MSRQHCDHLISVPFALAWQISLLILPLLKKTNFSFLRGRKRLWNLQIIEIALALRQVDPGI